MFKKDLLLIFLTTVFLSFDNQIKTMQESGTISESNAEIEQSISHCELEICRILAPTNSEVIKDIQHISHWE